MVLLDMEMPKNCFDCRFRTDTGECELTGFYTSYQELTMPLSESCPIKAEIPKNATNGDVIKALFPKATAYRYKDSFFIYSDMDIYPQNYILSATREWWNAPWDAPWKGDKDGK